MNTDRSLVEMIHKHVSTKRVKLPAFNGTALRIQKEIAKEEPDTRLIEKSIVSDQSLTGEVLRVSNSSFYRGLSQVVTVRDAIIRLGSKEVSNIVTLVALQNKFRSKDPIIHKIMGKLWRHSVGCAMGASWLAKQTGFQTICHETFVAGLLHDVGKLFILKAIDDMKISGEIDQRPSNTLIDEAMQNMHTEQGELLLNHWNLPQKYCRIAREHHIEDFDCNNILLVLVRLANHMCHKKGIALSEDPSIVLMATPEAHQLQISEVDLARLEVLLEDAQVLNA
ncbi:MAG: HDOD domain-containing protein [Desulfobacterales bacterium]|jgi:HD-like signal output (HDOD) protein